MAGRRHVAAPGEPQCPAEGCERPVGFATDHVGAGLCLRHSSHRAEAPPTPKPSPEPTEREEAAPSAVADPLARRLTGSRINPSPDPLAVMRRVLASARQAEMPFGEAWALGAEAALSYMSEHRAAEWWETLTSTEQAWASAYRGEGSRLADLTRER